MTGLIKCLQCDKTLQDYSSSPHNSYFVSVTEYKYTKESAGNDVFNEPVYIYSGGLSVKEEYYCVTCFKSKRAKQVLGNPSYAVQEIQEDKNSQGFNQSFKALQATNPYLIDAFERCKSLGINITNLEDLSFIHVIQSALKLRPHLTTIDEINKEIESISPAPEARQNFNQLTNRLGKNNIAKYFDLHTNTDTEQLNTTDKEGNLEV